MNTFFKWEELSLGSIMSGEVVTVAQKTDDDILCKKLTAMGILPGSSLTVISGSKNFSYILELESGSRIALSWDIVKKIMVIKSSTQRVSYV